MNSVKRKEQKSTSCIMSEVPRVQTPSKQLADEALSQRNKFFPVVDAVKDEVVEIEENEKVVQGDRNEEVALGGGGESSSRSRAIGKEVGERSTTDVEFRSEVQHSIPSTPGFVKTLSIDKFQVKMPIDDDTNFGDSVVKSVMGKVFDKFRVILKEQKLETFFRSSCFGLYLDLPENNNARFQMTMVYGLLKRRILYEDEEKKDEIWINYCGMPICFGIKEFAIITGLRCHHAVQPLPIVKPKNTTNKTKKVEGKEKIADDDDLVDIVGKSYKSTNLLKDLESKTLSSKHKESLCLVWFVHAILWAKDTNQIIPASLLKLSRDREEFNNYPWGHESYNLTVKYLLQKLTPKTINLYGFPWAFMAWAFEAIPHLRQQVKDYSEKVSYPRILRWLSAKNNIKVNAVDLFTPPDDAIVHPWLIPTELESTMPFLLTLGFVRTLPDPKVIDRIKRELDGATSIKREALGGGEEAVGAVGDPVGDVGGGFDGSGGGDELDDLAHYSVSEKGIDHDDGHNIGDFGVSEYGGFTPFSLRATTPPYKSRLQTSVGVASSSLCFTCQCKGCNERHAEIVNRIHALTEAVNKRHAELVNRIHALTEAVNSLAPERGINPSKRVSNSCIPIEIRRRKRAISNALSSIKVIRKVVNPLPHNVRSAVQLKLQKVNIYKLVDPPKNKQLEKKSSRPKREEK
ncbi:hypothetical protein KY290_035022 [Solanum tuberosum]|uniref:DUF1985 domain-containing protein n=1 Tax=Solanum tuberosum TaxID=4113 RepID=A0ABQ7U6W5_SOLTU|nr:hypothetical protein KY289_035091 [Solanum tuberosum]KAH0646351.1 hypothetical protein KY284_034235 [Solanum tuberosum]KAH0649049.1 hypothetical protein KY285_034297 [Solanum tuberosum]KAH0741979.1 hypothetical protein KY290_035022 [Solanum tuberosum]